MPRGTKQILNYEFRLSPRLYKGSPRPRRATCNGTIHDPYTATSCRHRWEHERPKWSFPHVLTLNEPALRSGVSQRPALLKTPLPSQVPPTKNLQIPGARANLAVPRNGIWPLPRCLTIDSRQVRDRSGKTEAQRTRDIESASDSIHHWASLNDLPFECPVRLPLNLIRVTHALVSVG